MFLEQKDWIRYRDILLQEIKERQKQEKSHKTFQFPAIIRDSNWSEFTSINKPDGQRLITRLHSMAGNSWYAQCTSKGLSYSGYLEAVLKMKTAAPPNLFRLARFTWGRSPTDPWLRINFIEEKFVWSHGQWLTIGARDNSKIWGDFLDIRGVSQLTARRSHSY